MTQTTVTRETTGSDVLLQTLDVRKSYGVKPVLRGIDLALRSGECVALLGANGAGKTTLLRILAGLTRPSAGRVCIHGLDITRDAQRARHLVGLVAHQPYLYEELSALENLLFFGSMYGVKHAHKRALELLQRVGLERRLHDRVGTFSRGQVQRLAWARALLHTPCLLLLDEPDTGLDQQGNAMIDTLLTEHLARGGGALIATHQFGRVLASSHMIIVLHKGRIAFQEQTAHLEAGSLEQVYQEVVR